MRTLVIALCVLALTATCAAAAIPKRAYWTVAKANVVAKKIKLPFCQAFPASVNCSNGVEKAGTPDGPLPLVEVLCTGTGKPLKGSYHTFSCKFTALNDLLEGTLSITVLGPTGYRWKLAPSP